MQRAWNLVKKHRQRTLLVGMALAAALILMNYLPRSSDPDGRDAPAAQRPAAANPTNPQRAYDYLKRLCDFGPRPSGSPAMAAQRDYLETFFKEQGAQVLRQEFEAPHPLTGQPVAMANLVVQWHPAARQRILLCAHYDTRPFPDRDRRQPRGVFVGANDGASGVAVLMELAHHMKSLQCRYGVDFALFDAEELVFADFLREQGTYFLGSEHFARQYVQQRPRGFEYRYAVLLDMVGDADLQIYHELHSVRWRETRPLVADIWLVAGQLGVREFIGRVRHEIRDDHLSLRNIGRIPACDIIDFDYPYWHTTEDTPDKCSADSLAKVAWVMYAWLEQVR